MYRILTTKEVDSLNDCLKDVSFTTPLSNYISVLLDDHLMNRIINLFQCSINQNALFYSHQYGRIAQLKHEPPYNYYIILFLTDYNSFTISKGCGMMIDTKTNFNIDGKNSFLILKIYKCI